MARIGNGESKVGDYGDSSHETVNVELASTLIRVRDSIRGIEEGLNGQPQASDQERPIDSIDVDGSLIGPPIGSVHYRSPALMQG